MAQSFDTQLEKPAKSPRKKPKKKPLASIQEIQDSLLSYVAQIKDPRVARTQKHKLTDILIIALLAVIGGGEGWEDKVEDHSNEITAIPALLELLDVQGAIITLDAMGTQTKIVQQIRQKNADYLVTLKANHPTLFSQVKQWFQEQRASHFRGINHDYYTSVEKGHHRTEKRYVWAVPITAFGGLYQQQLWDGLQTIVIVERIRHLWNETTHEIQFYLTSLPPDAQFLCRAIRTHWSIENQLHWTLDVTFAEDRCRIRSFHSPRNLALLRRLALNALNQETTLKRSLRQKRKQAAMNNHYMVTVLNAFCQA